MKKSICLLLVLCLALTLAACSTPAPDAPSPEAAAQSEPQSEAQTPVTYDLEEAGVSFDFPAELQNLKGIILPCYGSEFGSGSGIYLSGLRYYAFTEEQYNALAAKQGDLSEEEQVFVGSRIFDLIDIFAVDGGRGLETLASILTEYGQDTADYRLLGTVGEYSFFYNVNPDEDLVDQQIQFDEGFREEYESLIPVLENPGWIRIYEPKKPQLGEAGTLVAFETVDLDGNPIRSEDIFSAHKLTMVNIWGTFCGPCINEMPDLEVLNGRLAEKDCAIIGIVCDVSGPADTSQIDEAKEIVADTGVTYRNLLPWDGFDSQLPCQYIPTTYFVDSEGRLIGEPSVGSMGADDYEALIDAALAGIQ